MDSAYLKQRKSLAITHGYVLYRERIAKSCLQQKNSDIIKDLTQKKINDEENFNLAEINKRFLLMQWRSYYLTLLSLLQQQRANQDQAANQSHILRLILLLRKLKKRLQKTLEESEHFELELLDELEQAMDEKREEEFKVSKALCHSKVKSQSPESIPKSIKICPKINQIPHPYHRYHCFKTNKSLNTTKLH